MDPPATDRGTVRTTTNEMAQNRREFLKVAGAAGAAWSLSDAWLAPVSAQSPKGRTGPWRTWGTDAIKQARGLGCSYADIRFGRKRSQALNVRNGQLTSAGGFSFGGFGAVPGGGISDTFGFGVRVIHSGVWGFASSPIVSADEIRRIARMAIEVAKASAIAKKVDVKLAPVQAYQEYFKTPMVKDPTTVSATDKQAWAQAIVDKASKVQGVTNVTASVQFSYDWKYFAST